MGELLARIDEILKPTPDPFGIRNSTAEVIKHPQFVTINEIKLAQFGHQLNQAVIQNQLLTESQFGEIQNSPQKVFLLDTINFCFWPKKVQDKWTVEYPKGVITKGWQALVSSFDRALGEDTPLLNSQFLSNLSFADTQHLFRSHNKNNIPLLEARHTFLRQAGEILTKKFNGQIDNLIKQADFNATRIAQLVIDHFPLFNDVAKTNGQTVKFFKRAQICAYDLSLLPQLELTNLNQLTVFADYRLPQILHSYEVLQYEKSLADKIANLTLIDPDSREEIEIRAATIWAGELLAQQLNLTPTIVDNAIWHLAKNTTLKMKPHHRTLTTNY